MAKKVKEGEGLRGRFNELFFNSNSRRNDSNQTPSFASHNNSSYNPMPDDFATDKLIFRALFCVS